MAKAKVVKNIMKAALPKPPVRCPLVEAMVRKHLQKPVETPPVDVQSKRLRGRPPKAPSAQGTTQEAISVALHKRPRGRPSLKALHKRPVARPPLKALHKRLVGHPPLKAQGMRSEAHQSPQESHQTRAGPSSINSVTSPSTPPQRPRPLTREDSEVKNLTPEKGDAGYDHINARLERAALALKPVLPKGSSLPCRDVERLRITNHLRTGVMQGGSTQVLYVSGMPGTGKTATVLEVLEELRSQNGNFHLVHINAMRLGAPQQIFREIADQLPGKRVSNGQLHDHLTHFFLKRKREDPVTVLLVDEVDCLMTANQAVLYKVFDWLGMRRARLVLAAISNTMDLPERLLPRVASRFHIERVDFEPYNRSQLHEILSSRLKAVDGLEAFSGDVVLKLCAARVAAGSGDVRKALQVCRCAVSSCVQKSEGERGPVKIADLEAAEQELLFANPVTKAILSQSTQTRRFLAAVALELMQRDQADTVFLHQVSARFKKLLNVTAIDGERCSMELDRAAEEEMMLDSEVEDMAKYLTLRLQAMSILRVSSLTCGQAVSLGSLDVEELAVALLKVEEDPTVRELLEAGRFL